MKNRTSLYNRLNVNKAYLSTPGIKTTPNFFLPSILTTTGFQSERDGDSSFPALLVVH